MMVKRLEISLKICSNNNNSSSSSLITSMASRLSALEKSHKKMRMELVQKEKECLKMKYVNY